MLTDWRVEMLAQVNEYRKQSGKSVLAMDDRLNAMAKLHSDYQASVSKMTNGDPAGELRDRANYWGITGNILENVAHDSGDINSAMGTLKANDATNKHLLCDDCAIAGFGYSNGYWTQEFAQNGTVHTS
ncbi:hypothetical protein H4R18_000391 [Coemansia javaensis]|uniref:SCP domain-containing protein n=1 Tax=Coemansia javaensis TaxID=2761396 RepID=A0A9W8LN54_9FUNG|nr:hypothetical protein H4R18_000391 [Coemansia javaensis]